ncbi:MAG TPA: hypothetical protein DCZ10_06315 [Pelotomaculum sp.]|nr:hypothetical protein [Pelotomaculum sp.]
MINSIVIKAIPGTCLCDTCKFYYVSGSYGDEITGCGLANDCNSDDFYCRGCDGNNECQGCGGYENTAE